MAQPKVQPVLVAVDFSSYSATALVWAARLCDSLKLPLQVLHVVHDPEAAPGYYSERSDRRDHLRRIEETAAEMLDAFLATVVASHPGVKALLELDPILVTGLPVTRILEVADELDAQMIVVGSQGRTGLPHVLLGSKAERVAQLSPVPVTIVKQPESEQFGAGCSS